jgi:hypothetical protein
MTMTATMMMTTKMKPTMVTKEKSACTEKYRKAE